MHTISRALPRAGAALLTAVALAASGALLTALPAHAASSGLVITEVYGGGGNSGATLTNDFVELQNRGTTPVVVDGWSVQYHSKAATGTWQSTPLTGTIQPGAYYLVQEGKGTGGTQALPTPDATGTIAMSATDGVVALVQGTAALTCADSASCTAASVDLLGFGAAAIAEGAPATGASNTLSEQRKDGADTDVNSADFAAAAPTPGAANVAGGGGTTPPVDTTPGAVRIHDIQGGTFLSPYDGKTVTNVPGIVTAVRTTGSKGYFLQDPTPDADPATSEGLFVYTSSAPTVAVGDSVLVSATVDDYNVGGNPSSASVSSMAVTELTRPTTIVLAHGQVVPAPIVLTPTTVPEVYAPDLGGADIEQGAIQPARSALDFYESIEGMRVEVDDARVVGPSNSYGEQYVTTKPAQNASPRGGTVLEKDNGTPSGRLEVATATGSNPEVRVGDVFSGATVGVIDYSLYGGYTLVATSLGTVAKGDLQRTVATKQTANQLSVATYNVENLAPSDPDSKYAALAAGVVTNLASPDIVTVEEVQDNSGATDDGVVAADQTLVKLTQAIAAAGGPHYQWREIDPANDQDGGQPGGNIRIVFLFNPERVSFVDRGAASVDRTTTATAIQKTIAGPQLSLSPGRIDPASDAWTASRKPLVGQFRFNGQTVFVVGNHWNSKGGDQSADGRFQYPQQSSRVQREKQATEVHDFVASVLKADRNARVIVAGDLNDYQFSPPLQTLTSGGVLTDLITTLPKDEQYTYVYNGVSQVLDHILVSPAIASASGRSAVQYQVVHLNAEFEDQVSDHDPQVVRVTFPTAPPSLPVCSPSALALGYSDQLDKIDYQGARVGGLSSLAWDARSRSYVTTVDNHGSDLERIWFVKNLSSPTVVGQLVLTKADGTPYTGETADDEGLQVLPNGDFLVSSETEPSIRIFGRDGVQKAELPVPARFDVAPAGQATDNATLEGLAISPNGRTIVASMEGALSGDVSAGGDATAHRFLVYTADRRGSWTLAKQVAYRTEPGQRIPELQFYSDDKLLVEEASYSTITGNAVSLYAVTGLSRLPDVSSVADLSVAPTSSFASKKLVADLGTCPTLGASSTGFQANPLLDNYEGMAVTASAFGVATVSLISDDNFNATQETRILNLAVRLP